MIAAKLAEANELMVSLETTKSSIRNVKVRDAIMGRSQKVLFNMQNPK
ncbi:MAG: hypothetical protein IPJ13_32300 [Saprospiraceae bacterium]|nr:hypothetical protein [Saprospiraceae bacterium]